ncbi:MAG: hypothetical protein ACSHXW_14820 [Yoonia sp.]
MSKFNWVIAAAFGLGLLFAFSIAGYQLGRGIGELRGKGEAQAQNHAEHTSEQIQRACLGLDTVPQADCINAIIASSNENQRAENDLIAQTEMSTWAFWMLWTTIFMALVTAGGVYFVWRTLEATRQMAAETTRIGEAQVRAYITIEATTVTPTINPAGDYVDWQLWVEIRNTGQSPARKITIDIDRWFGNEVGDAYCPDLASGISGVLQPRFITPIDSLKFHPRNNTQVKIGITAVVKFEDVFCDSGEFREEIAHFVGFAELVSGTSCKLNNATAVIDRKDTQD